MGCCLLATTYSVAQPNSAPVEDLTELTLEELGSLSLSAAAKRAQPLFVTPAAVSVLLGDEIRRGGHSTIADALRLVPGAHVARSNDFRWAIGVRGFNGLSSTKLLVLVDGRTVYSPYYAGVDWAEADLSLADLDRIEVVRGPGATLWGANAVNGIINIISKSARETQGGLVTVRTGSGEAGAADVRYGGEINRDTWYRVYFRNVDTEHSFNHQHGLDHVGARVLRAGVRADGERKTAKFTLQADLVQTRTVRFAGDPRTGGQTHQVNTRSRYSALGRITFADLLGGELTVQAYADAAIDRGGTISVVSLAEEPVGLAENGGNFDIDVTHHRKLSSWQDLIWGGGVRHTKIDVETAGAAEVREKKVTQQLFNIFAQDELTLVPERLALTIGSKLERHETVGWQLLPSARLTFTPSPRQTFWAAWSRAVRSPSHSERDIRLPYGQVPATERTPPMRVELVGTSAFHEEVLNAFEAGWRFKPTPRVTLDLAAFHHDYHELRVLVPETQFQPMPPLILTELKLLNRTEADGYGVEANLTWRASDRWRFSATYAAQRLDPRGVLDVSFLSNDLDLPHRTWTLRAWYQLSSEWELSTGVYDVSALRGLGVPGYTRVDVHFTWRPRPDFEIGFGVQDAFDPAHLEYNSDPVFPVTEVQRNVFGRAQWRF